MKFDYYSFSNFWLVVDKNGIITNCSDYFELDKNYGKNIADLFDLRQPKLELAATPIENLAAKIIVFDSKKNGLHFRMTLHRLDGQFFIEGWPSVKRIEDLQEYNLYEKMLHPACQVMDVLMLKDILDKNEEAKLQLRIAQAKSEEEKAMQEELSRAKESFFASMSHEIRTPLNCIPGMVEEIKEEQPLGLEECVSALESSGKILLHTFNQILDFSKMNSEKKQIEEIHFNLNTFLVDLILAHTPSARKKKIRLSYELADLQFQIKSDSGRIGQVVNNLLANAIKFTSSGSVRLKTLVNEQSEFYDLTVSISDTGVGISDEVIERIFDAFVQAEASTSRQFGGTGLGLSISKKIVELMGGSIQVHSEVGKGSEFYFTIPVRKGTKRAKSELVVNEIPAIGQFDGKILVVEDNSYNQILIERLLKKWNCQVRMVGNGLEALHALKQHRYDLILMDCRMPEMDGYDCTKMIRQAEDAWYQKIPIIALTANGKEEDEVKCLEAGMDSYLAKPFRKEQVFEVLNKYLQFHAENAREKVSKAA